MIRSQRLIDLSVSLLLLVAATVYFSVWYAFHTVNLEQLQLFEGTWAYFAETVSVPGGFSDYLGRFLTQFFYHAWPGALILAGLLVLIRTLLRRVCTRKDAVIGAATFLPSILLMMVMCLRFPTVSLLTAFCLTLVAVLAVKRIRSTKIRRICTFLLIPVLYLLLGSLVVLFAAIVAIQEHNWRFSVVALLLAIACPLVASLVFPYPLGRLFYGLSYYKVHVRMPVWPWVAAVAAAAVVALAESRLLAENDRAWRAAYAAVFILAIPAVLLCSSRNDEQSLRYNSLAGKRAWNRIVTEATRRAPKTYGETACLNLALCKTGHLGGHMFEFQQDGPETLLPNENTPHHDGLSTAEIFYQLGMVNNARRYCFEALNAIPDYQKSAPVFKLLAEISLVNENFEMARKYLTTLSHTLFYRRWANERIALLKDPAGPFVLNEYTEKRYERYKGEDYIFDYNQADASIKQLLVEHPGNLTALNYLLAWYLLHKFTGDFVAACPFEAFTSAVPKAWQEGFVLDWNRSGYPADDLPEFITPSLAARFEAFTRDFNANVPLAAMQERYGDTYWFYYFFK
ncbi:MAG: hypothetical protein IJK79_04695 [Bacteroidales bacterium]|nr:hypothetical protein [Bacteroidales bacterium]